jgi:flagellin
MRIAHNITALLTNNQLSKSQGSLIKSFERLSSGQRINRASDDAAGLAISEKMRGQIRGLGQASRNLQDGIAMIQTADGAMNEVHSLLQRGRELSIQSANDTNTLQDKQVIQSEIEQIINEIDGISERTEFNTIKLLRGGGIIPPSGSGSSSSAGDAIFTTNQEITDALKGYMLKESEAVIENFYGITARAETPIEIIYQNDSQGGAVAWVSSMVNTTTGEAGSFKLVIDTADFLNSNLWISKDRIIAHEMVHAVMGASGMNMLDSAMPKWFKEGAAEYMAGADERLANSIAILGSEESVVQAIDAAPNSSHFYSASYAAVKYLDYQLNNSGSSIKDLMGILADGNLKSLDTALKEITDSNGDSIFDNGLTQFMNDFKQNGADFIRTNLDLDPSDGDIDGVGSIIGSLDDLDVIQDGNSPSDDPLNYFATIWSSSTASSPGNPFISIFNNLFEETGTIRIQAGANSQQAIELRFNKIDSTALGLFGVDVAYYANDAINLFDEAIQTVSAERGRLGAYQNRLEHAHSINEISAENTTSAESRIRDADIASEMMKQTKLSILTQAAQAILSQANQHPQSVLTLLR